MGTSLYYYAIIQSSPFSDGCDALLKKEILIQLKLATFHTLDLMMTDIHLFCAAKKQKHCCINVMKFNKTQKVCPS